MKKIRRYSCAKCGGGVTKPPCIAPPRSEKNRKGQMVEVKVQYNGLHGWRCDNCGPTKVSVVLEDMK